MAHAAGSEFSSAISSLDDLSSDVRIAAADSLRGCADPLVRGALTRKISDRCYRVRLAAIEALEYARSNEGELIVALAQGLCDWNPKVRIASAKALTGISSREAVSGLYEGLRAPEREFRQACAEALEPIRKAA